jgi:hypothetical protein
MLMRQLGYKLNLGMGMMFVLLCYGARAVFADDISAANLSPYQIFEKVRENYSSLSSYSDKGQITSVMDGAVVSTSFTTRLARPNFYLIEWDQTSKSSLSTKDTGLEGAWSSGAGNYVQMGWGVQRESDRDIALDNASDVSGGAIAIPRMFFEGQGNSETRNSIIGITRLADEKIGKIDCYMLAGESASGQEKTFWVGKRDFLIHQIRTDVSAQVMRADWPQAANSKLDSDVHSFYSVKTYTNIVLNQSFSREDFVPSFPLYERSN